METYIVRIYRWEKGASHAVMTGQVEVVRTSEYRAFGSKEELWAILVSEFVTETNHPPDQQ